MALKEHTAESSRVSRKGREANLRILKRYKAVSLKVSRRNNPLSSTWVLWKDKAENSRIAMRYKAENLKVSG